MWVTKLFIVALVVGGCLTFSQPAQALDHNKLFALINTQRLNIGQPVLVEEARLCTIAQNRAPAIYSEIYGGLMHAGFYALNLPYWASEIIINYNTDQGAFNWWLSSPVHRSIIQGNYKYSCLRCVANSCSAVFSNFTPKPR